MTFQKLIIFLFIFYGMHVYSQQVSILNTSEKIVLTTILQSFENKQSLNFSYDVKAIQSISLTINKNRLSIEALQKIIEAQTSYILEKVDATNYILIKNTKLINICGVIIDTTSKFELPQTEIVVDKKIIDITDAKGLFEIQVHPYDSITVTYFGYQKKVFRASNLSQKSCDTIRLQPEIEILEQVLVKEYLTGGISKNQDASVNISTKKLRILPGLAEPDVLQSLQLLPGISSSTEDPAGLYIRGGTPGQNLVLWDGIKMYQSGHFFNQISTFNPFITQNVQVYRGGTGVRYGDRISGVINIESDDDLTDKFKAGGGINLTHVDFYMKSPLSKKLGILIAARRSTTDIYQSLTFNNLVRKVFQNTRADISNTNSEQAIENRTREDDFTFLDFNFKTIWNPNNNNSLKFSSIFAENRLDNKKNGVIISNRTFNFKDILKNRNYGFSFNWDKNYTKTITQNINFYYSFYDQRYTLARDIIDLNINEVSFINNNVKDIGGEYSINFPVSDKQSLHLGYQFSYNEASYSEQIDFDELVIAGKGTNHTIYSEYKFKTPKTFLNIGFRASQLSNVNKFFIEPRIFISRELFKNFTLNSSAELKNQQLNNYISNNYTEQTFPVLPVSDNFWLLSSISNYSGIDDDDIAQSSIRVVKSLQFTLGGLYTYQGWNFDLEGYYKRITNFSPFGDFIIDLATQDNFDDDIYYGKEKRIGFDFLIKKRIRDYRFWVGYSISKNTISLPQVQNSNYLSNYDQTHVFNFSQTLKHNNFEYALGWNYATGRPFTEIFPDSNSGYGAIIAPNSINRNRYKAYHRLDASILYHFKPKAEKNWNGFIGFSLRNLYNRKNIINQGYREVTNDDFSTILENFENQSLRITPDIVFRINF